MSVTGVLGRAALMARLASDPPLVAGLADLTTQVQPHGIDLRLDSVWRFSGAGGIFADAPANAPGARTDRQLPAYEPVAFDPDGRVHLLPGPCLVRFMEVVNLPTDLMALGRSRSTLLRCGAALHTAVWDAGYVGRSEALLVVSNPGGLALEHGARLMQLVFLPLDARVEGYSGAYQGENLPSERAG